MWTPQIPLKKSVSVDLHGLSVQEAKQTVQDTVHLSDIKQADELTVITGRGKHINSRGTRGVLFNAFPKWIKMKSVAPLIKEVETNIGHYKLKMQKQLHTQSGLYEASDDKPNKMFDQFINKMGLKSIEQKANSGDVVTLGMLGYIYLNGLAGTKKDLKKGLEYIHSAAAKEEPLSLLQLAYFCSTGKYGVEYNPKKAFQYFKRVANTESSHGPEGQLRIGICYLLAQGVDQNDAEAIKWLEKAAENGHPLAHYNLANCYASGWGVAQDDKQACHYYEKAAKCDVPDAQVELADRYLKGNGLPKDETKSFIWRKKAAELGHVESLYQIVKYYSSGKCNDMSKEAAYLYSVELNLRAAQAGHAQAQVDAAFFYFRSGNDTSRLKIGLEWLEKAIAQNNSHAFLLKAMLHESGNAVLKKDPTLVLQCLKQAATLGNVPAQKRLWDHCMDLEDAEGVNMALQLIMESSRAGDPLAQFVLGNILSTHPEKDDKLMAEAMHLYEASATQGCVEAQLKLAEHFLDSKPSPENNEKIVYWYTKAAELGDPFAQTMMGCIYHKGEHGIPKNDNKAYIWLNKAAKQNYPKANLWIADIIIKSNTTNDRKLQEAKKLLESAANAGEMEAVMILKMMKELQRHPKTSNSSVSKKFPKDSHKSAQQKGNSPSPQILFSIESKSLNEDKEDKSLLGSLMELIDQEAEKSANAKEGRPSNSANNANGASNTHNESQAQEGKKGKKKKKK